MEIVRLGECFKIVPTCEGSPNHDFRLWKLNFSITSETSDNGIVEIKVKALYDYKAKEDDEINLKKGQILTQMKPGDNQGTAVLAVAFLWKYRIINS